MEFKRTVFPCVGVWFLALLWGGSREPVLQGGRFFQPPVDQEWMRRRTNAKADITCLLAQEVPAGVMLDRTTAALQAMAQGELARRGGTGKDDEDGHSGGDGSPGATKLVLWSETAALDEPGLVDAAASIAGEHGAYIGVAYLSTDESSPPQNQRNMLTLVGPSGQVLWSYQKAHPVTLGFEPNSIPGRRPLPLAHTQGLLGTVGGAICFDFDFPTFVHQVSSSAPSTPGDSGASAAVDASGDSSSSSSSRWGARPDVMLQPSWTWGALGRWHALMDTTRAVEGGFNLVRCSSGGTSGVWTPFGSPLVVSEDADAGGFTARVPLPPHVPTVYGATGDAFAWAVVFAALGLGTVLALPATTRARLQQCPTQHLLSALGVVPALLRSTGDEDRATESSPLARSSLVRCDNQGAELL